MAVVLVGLDKEEEKEGGKEVKAEKEKRRAVRVRR